MVSFWNSKANHQTISVMVKTKNFQDLCPTVLVPKQIPLLPQGFIFFLSLILLLFLVLFQTLPLFLSLFLSVFLFLFLLQFPFLYLFSFYNLFSFTLCFLLFQFLPFCPISFVPMLASVSNFLTFPNLVCIPLLVSLLLFVLLILSLILILFRPLLMFLYLFLSLFMLYILFFLLFFLFVYVLPQCSCFCFFARVVTLLKERVDLILIYPQGH